jgi:hypothetical protein
MVSEMYFVAVLIRPLKVCFMHVIDTVLNCVLHNYVVDPVIQLLFVCFFLSLFCNSKLINILTVCFTELLLMQP